SIQIAYSLDESKSALCMARAIDSTRCVRGLVKKIQEIQLEMSLTVDLPMRGSLAVPSLGTIMPIVRAGFGASGPFEVRTRRPACRGRYRRGLPAGPAHGGSPALPRSGSSAQPAACRD